jgi:hypothetical protein
MFCYRVYEEFGALKMYQQYLSIKDCSLGKGVFTSVKIPMNSLIMELSGTVLLDRDISLDKISECWQIGPNTFMVPSGNLEDYLNHNCTPNCGLFVVGNRAILMSMYNIPAGMELNVDYSITSTDTMDTWKMDCKCGSAKCRKIISGYEYLDENTKQLYDDKNVLPLYIKYPNMFYKI